MCPGDGHTSGRRDESRIDIVFAQRHVGAIRAVEDQRKLLLIADAQQHQRGQPRGIGPDRRHIDALAHQFLADEPAHMLIANAGDQRRFQPQPGGAGGHVGGRAADVFLKRPHVFQPPADLRAVKIDRGSTDGDQIKAFGHVSISDTLIARPSATDFSAASASAKAISPS